MLESVKLILNAELIDFLITKEKWLEVKLSLLFSPSKKKALTFCN